MHYNRKAMNEKEFFMKFCSNLNTQQKEAVKSVDGPVLLSAVPGSGKTHVLTLRLGYMVLCKNIDPDSILVMTYTNAAVREMQARYIDLFGETGKNIRFCTINSLSVGIIHSYEQISGRRNIYQLADEKQIRSLLSDIYLKICNEYPSESDLADIHSGITYVKNRMISEQEIAKVIDIPHFEEIYDAYGKGMKKMHWMDFDDQMVFAYAFLQKVKPLLEWYQRKYIYYCIDEAQDTSLIQHRLIALLASKSRNLFMVGDEDQSIYGFRAAYPEALQEFDHVWNKGKILYMETNYRSSSPIVQAADIFIQNNKNRRPKRIHSFHEAGSPVHIIHVAKRSDQYKLLLAQAYYHKEQTAVLFRNNESALPLIDLFERKNIPWRSRPSDGLFFTNRIVKDMIDILTFSIKPDPDLFMHLYYRFGINIRKEQAQAAVTISKKSNVSPFIVLSKDEHFAGRTRRLIGELNDLLTKAAKSKADQAIDLIFNESGYGDYAKDNGLDITKLSILKQIGTLEGNIPSFLSHLDELKYIVQNHENPADAHITLSTIHSAKGREFERVFLLDAVNTVLPLVKEDKDPVQYQEERRLFYVGITRARKDLYLFDIADTTSEFVEEVVKRLPKEKHLSDDFSVNLQVSFLHKKYYDSFNHIWTIQAQCEDQFLLEDTDGNVVFNDLGTMLMHRKKIYEEPLKVKKKQPIKIKRNMFLQHVTFGRGRVTQVHGNTMTVLFQDTERRLNIEKCLKKHLIEIVD